MMWKNPAANVVLSAGGIVLASCGLIACLDEAGANPEQPVPFSHRAHVELQIDCSFCHQYYDKYAAAGIPRIELCVTCHEAMPQDNPGMKKIFDYADAGEEIPWVRLYQLPQFNYFSHKWHVRAGVECVECHGAIGQSDRAVRHMEYEMNWCLDCHNQRKASVDCVTCHK